MVEETKRSKGERTRERIARSFIRLMTQKRWDKVTVREICAEADITRGTFYQYFDDIYDLMERIQNRLLEDLRNRYKTVHTPKSYREEKDDDGHVRRFSDETPEIFIVWFRFCRENEDAMLALTDEDKGDPYFRKKLQDLVTLHLDRMMDWDGMPRDALRSHFLQLFFSMYYHTMFIWLSGDADIPPEKMAQVLNSMRLGTTFMLKKETGREPEMPPKEGKM